MLRSCYHDLNVLVRSQAVDVLLGELCPSLDEDMADLDEYEMGAYDNPQRKYEYQFINYLPLINININIDSKFIQARNFSLFKLTFF